MKELSIWGKKIKIEIRFDCFEDEEILPFQQEALDSFLAESNLLFQNCLQKVKNYCIAQNREDIGQDTIADIFQFVEPKMLYIERTKNEDHVVDLICDYQFDPEGGLAIVFKDNKFVKIVLQDDVF